MNSDQDSNFWMIEHETRQSPIHGTGQFALQNITADNVVMVLSGMIGKSGSMPIRGTNLFVDNPQSYINHSPTPNLYLDGQIVFRSSRSIAQGEELTLDYTLFAKLTFEPMQTTKVRY